ncbi:DUF2399 domain-containing protein [Streptomyces sp. MB09-01]|uniref:DUF2399 domain-containing protein n=1 Tax=Streptomyces sp. MB09-01 TaxID=3028666 RepID=UPI0029A76D63|nr:DUF2399 domain-containing protein [Streptomyces sp. MB09-01]
MTSTGAGCASPPPCCAASRQPWRRFTAAEYRAAELTGPVVSPLIGRPAEAPWDPELSGPLAELGSREEETVVGQLLSDLV